MDAPFDFTLKTPVLLVGFNRPDTISPVFDRIAAARPTRLYVAIDGPRPDQANPSDTAEDTLVEQVRQIVQQVDWPCQAHYRFNETNLGAEVTISSAIDWVFEKEEYVIIIEDDIIAPLSFFRFAEEMLVRYKDDDRISMVTGNNFTPIPLENGDDYLFAKYGHSTGWGTWKRFWQNFDLNLSVDEHHLSNDFLQTITNSEKEMEFFRWAFNHIKNQGPGNSSWDFIGLYLHRVTNALAVIPRENLTSNIGTQGLHTNGRTDEHFRKVDENFVVKKHPEKVACYTAYDIHHFEAYTYPDFLRIQANLKRTQLAGLEQKKITDNHSSGKTPPSARPSLARRLLKRIGRRHATGR